MIVKMDKMLDFARGIIRRPKQKSVQVTETAPQLARHEQFPFSSTPEFRQGTADFNGLNQHHKIIDTQTGKRFVQGLRLSDTVSVPVPGDFPPTMPDYFARDVLSYIGYIRPVLEEGKTLALIRGGMFDVWKKENLIKLTQATPKGVERFSIENMVRPAAYMTGFGKAALDAGDFRAAILALHGAAKGRNNPQIRGLVEQHLTHATPRQKEEYVKALKEVEDWEKWIVALKAEREKLGVSAVTHPTVIEIGEEAVRQKNIKLPAKP